MGHVNPVTDQSIKIGDKTYQKFTNEKLLTPDAEGILEYPPHLESHVDQERFNVVLPVRL